MHCCCGECVCVCVCVSTGSGRILSMFVVDPLCDNTSLLGGTENIAFPQPAGGHDRKVTRLTEEARRERPSGGRRWGHPSRHPPPTTRKKAEKKRERGSEGRATLWIKFLSASVFFWFIASRTARSVSYSTAYTRVPTVKPGGGIRVNRWKKAI